MWVDANAMDRYELTGRRARKLLKRLIGAKKYKTYPRSRRVVIKNQTKVYEIVAQRSQVYVFKNMRDYNKFRKAQKKYNTGYESYGVSCGYNPVDYEAWCVQPDFEKLGYDPFDAGQVHEDEEVLAKVLLAKINPKFLRKKAAVTYMERDDNDKIENVHLRCINAGIGLRARA